MTLAAVLQAPRRLELLTRPTPVARRGEAVVRIAATAVCHTDLEIYTGRHPGVRLPVVMGHEATDVVVDAAGDPALIAPAIEMLAPGGRLLVYGISHRPVPDFTTFPLYFKELTLYGSRALTPGDFAPAIDLVASGAVDVDGFITASYPLERVAAAFEEYERSADSVLRLVIVPHE